LLTETVVVVVFVFTPLVAPDVLLFIRRRVVFDRACYGKVGLNTCFLVREAERENGFGKTHV